MITKIIPTVLIVAFIACSVKREEGTSDSVSQFDSANATSNEEYRNTLIVQENLLRGPWGSEGSENAIMSIRQDSIYYVDSDKTFRYDLNSDTIRIYYDDWIYEGIIKKLTKDSLVIVDAKSETKFFRFRN